MTSRLSWPAAAELILTAAIAAAAGASFQRVFGLSPLIPVLATAAILPAVLSAFLFSQRRWLPVWAAFLASMGAWLIVAGAALLHGTDLAALRTSLSDGWWQMLTTILPAPASGRLLLDVHLLVWLGSMTAAEIVLRTRMILEAGFQRGYLADHLRGGYSFPEQDARGPSPRVHHHGQDSRAGQPKWEPADRA